MMYRFHPSVVWGQGYPNRQQIVDQVRQLWERYGLDGRTKFNTKVTKVYQDDWGRWVINDPAHGRFDGVISAIGTCGDRKVPDMPGMDKFKGEIYHSSDLTGKSAKGKKLIVIGGGASAVEALEFATQEGAEKVSILARSEKWIIPRNPFWNMLLALNIFGQETKLSWIPETLLRKFFYRDLQDMAPADKGIFTDTPMVNSDVMEQIRSRKAEWLRCDIERFDEKGVLVNHRAKGVGSGGPGHQELIEGDMVVMATGYKRPELSFLPESCFEKAVCRSKLVSADLPAVAPLDLLHQLHIRERHRNRGKLARRHLHAHSAHVPHRPSHPAEPILDEAVDRHDASPEGVIPGWAIRVLHLPGARLVVSGGNGPFSSSLASGSPCQGVSLGRRT